MKRHVCSLLISLKIVCVGLAEEVYVYACHDQQIQPRRTYREAF